MLTNLKPTFSIVWVSDVVCATIHRSDLLRFLDDFREWSDVLNKKLESYKDYKLQNLHKIIKNVKWFSSLKYSSVRAIVFKLEEKRFAQESIIIRQFQIDSYFYLLTKGEVNVFVSNSSNNSKILLFTLKEGATFNIWGGLMSQHSLFSYEASTDCIVMVSYTSLILLFRVEIKMIIIQ